MDDEPAVRNILARMLRYHGNYVDEVGDGNSALVKYKEAMGNGDPYDVVIMDLFVSDGLGGEETMIKLLQFDPEAKGIISSGYINHPVVVQYSDYGFKDTIPKPYRLHELLEVVSDVMSGAKP